MIIFFDMYLDMTRRDMYEKKNEHNNKKDEVYMDLALGVPT